MRISFHGALDLILSNIEQMKSCTDNQQKACKGLAECRRLHDIQMIAEVLKTAEFEPEDIDPKKANADAEKIKRLEKRKNELAHDLANAQTVVEGLKLFIARLRERKV